MHLCGEGRVSHLRSAWVGGRKKGVGRDGRRGHSLDDDVGDDADDVGAVEGCVDVDDDEQHGPGEELEQAEDKVFGRGEVVAGGGDNLDEGEEEGEDGDGEDDRVETVSGCLVRCHCLTRS